MCDPLGSHHTEAFSIQELGVQLSLRGSDHTHTVTDTNTYTHMRTHALHTSTHYFSRSHTHALMLWAVLWTDPCHWRELADNNIILWPSYGNMVLLLWKNMNIMAFRGGLGNYMAVMLLSFNRIFRFSIYLGSLGGKSIKLFTFAMICAGMLYIQTCENVQRQNRRRASRCHWVKVTAQRGGLAHIWLERIA